MLEKNNAIPIYLQLKNILRISILNGEYEQGRMIPSETRLAEKYNITRSTVRRSISELVNENLLRKEHGKGTFVSLAPVHYSIWNFTGFTDYVQKKGKIPTSKILSTEKIIVNNKNYFKLERARGIKDGLDVLYLTVDTSCIPLDLFPGITTFDFEKRSLYDVMRKEYQVFPSIVELTIKPYLVDARIANVFGITANLPLLMVQGSVSSNDNTQIELTQVIYSPNIDFNLATQISAERATK